MWVSIPPRTLPREYPHRYHFAGLMLPRAKLRRNHDQRTSDRQTARPEEQRSHPPLARFRHQSGRHSPVRLCQGLLAPHQQTTLGSRIVSSNRARPYVFAERLQFHSALEDQCPAGSNLVAVLLPSEPPPTRPMLPNKRIRQTCLAGVRKEI